MKWLVASVLVACACSSSPAPRTTTTGSGSGSGGGTGTGTACDAVTTKVGDLYRAEAQGADKGGGDPARVAELVADNTAMVMSTCNRAPEAVSACIGGVRTVAQLEADCLPRLDEEGSEADVLAR